MGDLQNRVEQFLYRKAELCDRHAWTTTWNCSTRTPNSTFPVGLRRRVHHGSQAWDVDDLLREPRRPEDRSSVSAAGKSAVIHALPRTLHLVSNVMIQEAPTPQPRSRPSGLPIITASGGCALFAM